MALNPLLSIVLTMVSSFVGALAGSLAKEIWTWITRRPESVIPPLKPNETQIVRIRGRFYRVDKTKEGKLRIIPLKEWPPSNVRR